MALSCSATLSLCGDGEICNWMRLWYVWRHHWVYVGSPNIKLPDATPQRKPHLNRNDGPVSAPKNAPSDNDVQTCADASALLLGDDVPVGELGRPVSDTKSPTGDLEECDSSTGYIGIGEEDGILTCDFCENGYI